MSTISRHKCVKCDELSAENIFFMRKIVKKNF